MSRKVLRTKIPRENGYWYTYTHANVMCKTTSRVPFSFVLLRSFKMHHDAFLIIWHSMSRFASQNHGRTNQDHKRRTLRQAWVFSIPFKPQNIMVIALLHCIILRLYTIMTCKRLSDSMQYWDKITVKNTCNIYLLQDNLKIYFRIRSL